MGAVPSKYASWFENEQEEADVDVIDKLKDSNDTNNYYLPGEDQPPIKKSAETAAINDLLRQLDEAQQREQQQQPEELARRMYNDELDDFHAEEDTDDEDGDDVAETDVDQLDDLLDPSFTVEGTTNPEAYRRPAAAPINSTTDDFIFQHTETTYGIDETFKVPEIRLWGVNAAGNSVLIRSRKFKPYFFAHITSSEEADRIRVNLEKYLRKEFAGKKAGKVVGDKFVLSVEKVYGRSLCGWHRNKPLDVLHRFTMAHPSHVAAARNCLGVCVRVCYLFLMLDKNSVIAP